MKKSGSRSPRPGTGSRQRESDPAPASNSQGEADSNVEGISAFSAFDAEGAVTQLPGQGDFLTTFSLLEEDLEKAGLTWGLLESIGKDYIARLHELSTTADYIAARLRRHPAVHSVRTRIKDPKHLLEKIVRKRRADGSRTITRTSYDTEITDLIGIRVLHLFKTDWEAIHAFVQGCWNLAERPVANVRRGDPESVLNGFRAAGCDVHEHPMGYRSVHYLLKSQPSKRVIVAELQVRTIFEEAWSEIDHRIRYPYKLDDPILAQYLQLLNGLAGSADEMGTFIQDLSNQLDELEQKRLAEQAQHEATVAGLRREIEQLSIDAKEKKKLESRIKELERQRAAGLANAAPYQLPASGAAYSGFLSSSPALSSLALLGSACKSCGMASYGTLDSDGYCPTCRLQRSLFQTKFCERCGTQLSLTGLTNEKLCVSCRMVGNLFPTRSR